MLQERDWDSANGALGLPKVSHRKVKAGKKKGVAEKAEGETEE